jgi:signal transduction histidine kinase
MRDPEKANILLVDDQPARLLTYQSVLSVLNQNLVCASSGLEALEKLMHDDFAVVLLDVSMPEMDGFEAAALIHEHPRFEKTPIIFVTGVHVTELDRLKGYKAGAVDYVSIPVVPEILRSKVAALVELYCQRRELSDLNRRLARANEQLSHTNTALQLEKTRELQAVNDTLQRANADLARANRDLQVEIKERTKVERALAEANRHKDEFLAILAHELRNPLAPIRTAAHIMRRKPLEDPELCLARDVIERQLSHLTRLVDDLLDVSRVTTGKIKLTLAALDVSDFVARAIETVQPLMEGSGHQFSVEMCEEPLKMQGDGVRLTQAIANLLENAAKYTERGGRISLSVRRRGTSVEISVRDTGIGIARDAIPRIFDLFAQPDSRLERPQGGLGIGLALVRRVVELHRGTVSARSGGLGLGSEFEISLPLVERAVATEKSMTASTQIDSVRRRILIADDNGDALESLATLLRLDGHEVYTAADGQLALQMAERHVPEVALLDIGMPRINGYDLARRIRSQPWGKEMALVALTGWGQKSDRVRSQEAGFRWHLVKPVDHHDLKRLLAELPELAQAS